MLETTNQWTYGKHMGGDHGQESLDQFYPWLMSLDWFKTLRRKDSFFSSTMEVSAFNFPLTNSQECWAASWVQWRGFAEIGAIGQRKHMLVCSWKEESRSSRNAILVCIPGHQRFSSISFCRFRRWYSNPQKEAEFSSFSSSMTWVNPAT